MFRLLFLLIGALLLIYFIVEGIYQFPILALDGFILIIGIFLYQLLKRLRRESFKGFILLVSIGMLISIVNFLPIKVPKNDLNKYISTRGVIRHMLEYKPHIKRIKTRKIMNLFEFGELSKTYFIIFVLKYFYMVFITSLLISELKIMPLPFFGRQGQSV